MATSTPAPEVTVVIPARDRPGLLTECIRSIREPEGLRWQAIVVDDGSEQDLQEVVRRHGDPRVVHVRQEPRGASAARNRGLALASGRFVKFLDGDDELEAGILARQVAALDETAADVAYSDWRFSGRLEDPRVGGEPVRRARQDGPILVRLLEGWWCASFSYLFRSDVARRVGWDERLRNWQDFDYVVGVAATGARFVHVPAIAGSYRLHGEGQITSGDPARLVEARMIVMEKLVSLLDSAAIPATQRERARRAVAQLHWEAAHVLYTLGRELEGEDMLRRMTRLLPGYVPRAHAGIQALVRAVGPVRCERILAQRRRVMRYLGALRRRVRALGGLAAGGR